MWSRVRSICGAVQISYTMKVYNQPYNHLIVENYMPEVDFLKCQQSISFDEIQKYCSNPAVHEHDNSLHGNYSMPVDETKNANWMFDYFANDKTFDLITEKLYGRVLKADHCYINLHWDNADTSLGVHNDQKKYRWLVTGQLYVEGDPEDGVILQNDHLEEITKVPLKPNLFYAMATSMYSWHYVKNVAKDKISILVRFGKKQINTVTNPAHNTNYAVIVENSGHYDGHYSKLGMRMANMTEAWLSNQGYVNIHMSEWNNNLSLDNLKQYCAKHYGETIIVPSGYLGEKDLLTQNVEDSDVEFITKENIKERAEIIFNRSKYTNTRFREGEMILRSFDPLGNFTSTKEVVLK